MANVIEVEATSAANAAAVVNVPAPPAGDVLDIDFIDVSYSAAPTAGRLDIQDGATVVFSADVTVAGQTPIELPEDGLSIRGALTATLAAGGAAVVGRLNLGYFTKAV